VSEITSILGTVITLNKCPDDATRIKALEALFATLDGLIAAYNATQQENNLKRKRQPREFYVTAIFHHIR